MNTATVLRPFQFICSVRDPDEWAYAWGKLASFWGDHCEHNAAYGESWQYMGTELVGDTWEHVFRHRMHPRAGKRVYWRTPATDEYNASHNAPAARPVGIPGRFPMPPLQESVCVKAFEGVSIITVDGSEL